jgi:hypothetical protein
MEINLPIGGDLERREDTTPMRHQQDSLLILRVDCIEKTRDTACDGCVIFTRTALAQTFDIRKRRNDVFTHNRGCLAGPCKW